MALTGREVAARLGVSRPRAQQLKASGELEDFSEQAVRRLKEQRDAKAAYKAARIERLDLERREAAEWRTELLNELRYLNRTLLALAAAAGVASVAHGADVALRATRKPNGSAE